MLVSSFYLVWQLSSSPLKTSYSWTSSYHLSLYREAKCFYRSCVPVCLSPPVSYFLCRAEGQNSRFSCLKCPWYTTGASVLTANGFQTWGWEEWTEQSLIPFISATHITAVMLWILKALAFILFSESRTLSEGKVLSSNKWWLFTL